MTERENMQLLLNNKVPQWTPCFYDAYQPFGISLLNNQGEFMKGGKDMFGTMWVATEKTGWQVTPDPSYPPVLEDICDWRDVIKFPNLDEMDWAGAAEQDGKIFNFDRENKMICCFGLEGNFVRLQALMGTENALCAMIEDPDEVYAFFAAYTDFRCDVIERTAKYYKPDIYVNGDDVCTQTGLYFSPKMHKELIRPFELQLGEVVTNCGMIHEEHCCGKCEDYLIEHFIDMKARIWQTAQSMNDLVHIKEVYGDKLLIHGGWNTYGPTGQDDASEEVMREEVRRCIDSYAKGGKYMLFPVVVGEPVNEARRRKIVSDECRKYSEKFYADPANR